MAIYPSDHTYQFCIIYYYLCNIPIGIASALIGYKGGSRIFLGGEEPGGGDCMYRPNILYDLVGLYC